MLAPGAVASWEAFVDVNANSRTTTQPNGFSGEKRNVQSGEKKHELHARSGPESFQDEKRMAVIAPVA